jgi:hypothetical protein
MPVLTMPPVRVCHAFKYFYPAADMLDNDTPARKPPVVCLFPAGQLTVFTRLYRDETVRMILPYPQASEIGVKRDRIAHVFPGRAFICLEIMLAAVGL